MTRIQEQSPAATPSLARSLVIWRCERCASPALAAGEAHPLA